MGGGGVGGGAGRCSWVGVGVGGRKIEGRQGVELGVAGYRHFCSSPFSTFIMPSKPDRQLRFHLH